MKKYFYTDGVAKFGPFSFDELKEENLTRDTKLWFYGLEKWKSLSEIEELKSIYNSIPPDLSVIKNTVKDDGISTSNKISEKTIKKKKHKLIIKRIIVIIGILLILFLIGNFINKKVQKNRIYQEIVANSYETDIDFDFYIDKFYRDIAIYGIFPKKPKKKIIKFAKLDHLDDLTYIHGISFGMNDDNKIEIYVNPSTWEEFNKPLRYYLIYHELAHDVLNVDDLKPTPENYGKLMYPEIASYESKTMDDFIESSHALFEEVASKRGN